MSRPPHPRAGQRLVPNIVDDLAAEAPDRILYEYPTSADLFAQPWERVSARRFAQAVDRAAHWIAATLGRPGAGDGVPRLGYSGPADLRYLVLVPAAVKAGYVMLYTSLRNSPEGDAAVIAGAGCHTWLVPAHGGGQNIQRVLDQGLVKRAALRLVDLPDMDYFVGVDDGMARLVARSDGPSSTASDVPPFPYAKRTLADGGRDPVWVLHTSGSTGHPKPVVRYLDSVASSEANTLLRPIDGRPLLLDGLWSVRAYQGFPLFHAAGLNNGLLWPLVYGGTILLGPPGLPVLTADVVADVVRAARPAALYLPPSLLEDLTHDPAELEELLAGVDAVGYAGGPLAQATGDLVARHTVLRQGIGTTETGWLPAVALADPARDWLYTHVHPDTGNEFQARGSGGDGDSGGLYELVAVRRPHLAQWQPIFSTFPDLDTYPFRDLYARHPDPAKAYLFRYEGRLDNILVLSNGEKVQPHATELAVAAHPRVADAVVVGHGRFQVALLVQPASAADEANPAAFVRAIWPAIEAANTAAPAHAQIHADFVIVGSPAKPFVKTGKGTVRRGPTISLYEAELDAVYSQAAAAGQTDLPAVDLASKDALHKSLRALVQHLIKTAASSSPPLADDADLFADAGIDSLQVLAATRQITRGLAAARLGSDGPVVPASFLYRNPTLAGLTRSLWSLYQEGATEAAGRPAVPAAETNAGAAAALLDRFLAELPPAPDGGDQTIREAASSPGLVIVLTGSTGSLGSYLLEALLHTTAVHTVWCLNRAVDGGRSRAEATPHTAAALRAAAAASPPKQVLFRRAVLGDPQLGLGPDDYAALQGKGGHHRPPTHILHTQWQVDFNLGATSFAPHLAGVVGLVRLCVEADGTPPHLLFTSSVGVVHSSTESSVPEAPLAVGTLAVSGYGVSKHVAEQILLAAAARHHLPVTICRVGQISGPVHAGHESGVWNEKEWFPSIVQFSAHAGVLPATLGRSETVDWIPVDDLANILLELAGIVKDNTANPQDNSGTATIAHAVHPHPVSWADALRPTVQTRLAADPQKKRKIDVVPLSAWLGRLRTATATAGPQDEATLAALRLLPFLSSLAGMTNSEGADGDVSDDARPRFATTASEQRSRTLRGLAPTGPDAMTRWLDQWGL